MTIGTARVIRGNALALPLPDESVDLIVTSPPYWSLRQYTDGGAAYHGQIGGEDTPGEFIDNLVAATAEMIRVLKPSGSIWVNLGDKYQATSFAPQKRGKDASGVERPTVTLACERCGTEFTGGPGRRFCSSFCGGSDNTPRAARGGVPVKSLIGIPWRYALRCIGGAGGTALDDPAVVKLILRDVALGVLPLGEAERIVDELHAMPGDDGLGLILRAEVIWSKCLSGGARLYIRTATGDRPVMLRDLVRAYRPQDCQVWNGQRWTQVLAWERTPDDDGALEFELRTGERIGCTTNHRWPTTRGVLRADEIRVGDVITTTRLPEPDVARTPALLPDEDIGWLAGLYIAEGSRSETTVQIAGHIREDARHARLARIAAALDATCTVYRTGPNTVTANLRGSVLAGVLDRYVSPGTAKTKRLRMAAWQRTDTFLAAVVDGYLSGDGHFDAKNDRWRLGFTANDEWAADLRTLAARVGAVCRLRRTVHTGSFGAHPGWRGEWRWTRSPHRNAKPDGEVVAIRASRARDFYDVEVVDDPHLFALASGVLTHNSNGLPESVTDRVRRSHETWFHFTREPRYYSAVDEIREPHLYPDDLRHLRGGNRSTRPDGSAGTGNTSSANPLGKLPGSVWEIPTSPLTVPDHLGIDHYACVDTDTEILTRRGWLRHDEVQAGDECAGYDLDAGMARWTPVHAVHQYPFSGDLVSVEKRDLSMRLTENHRAVVVRRGKTLVVRADAMRPTDAIPRSAAWLPDEPSAGIGEDVAALCGWVAAEGWYQPTGCVQLSQSASVNPDKVAAIDKCIAGIPYLPRDAGTRGISYERGAYRARLKHRGARANLGSFATSQEAGDALTAERERLGIDGLRRTEATRTWKGRDWIDVTWRLPRGLGQRIRDLMPDKLLTADLANLPLHEARALFDAFVDGDGHRRSTLSADMRISIYQKRRENLDWLQFIAVRLGYRTTLSRDKDRWVLYCNEARRPLTLRGTNGTTVPVGRERYDGIVWCPTTGTGTFIARRNGRVFITGNSFPLEWPRRIIAGWSPPGICTACGQGRRPTADVTRVPHYAGGSKGRTPGVNHGNPGTFDDERIPRTNPVYTLTGYACWCPDTTAPTTPAVILDPFGGTGTTALAAKAAGRTGITIDMSADYCRLATWRTTDPGQLAAALQVDKPAPVAPDQLDLLEGLLA